MKLFNNIYTLNDFSLIAESKQHGDTANLEAIQSGLKALGLAQYTVCHNGYHYVFASDNKDCFKDIGVIKQIYFNLYGSDRYNFYQKEGGNGNPDLLIIEPCDSIDATRHERLIKKKLNSYLVEDYIDNLSYEKVLKLESKYRFKIIEVQK